MHAGSLITHSASLAPPLAFGGGPWEIAIIILVILLVFGSKLPKMARNLGKSFVEFKKGVKGSDETDAESLPAGEEPKKIAPDSGRQEGGQP
jgi:TatA/E family protein of Tat protein translocase